MPRKWLKSRGKGIRHTCMYIGDFYLFKAGKNIRARATIEARGRSGKLAGTFFEVGCCLLGVVRRVWGKPRIKRAKHLSSRFSNPVRELSLSRLLLDPLSPSSHTRATIWPPPPPPPLHCPTRIALLPFSPLHVRGKALPERRRFSASMRSLRAAPVLKLSATCGAGKAARYLPDWGELEKNESKRGKKEKIMKFVSEIFFTFDDYLSTRVLAARKFKFSIYKNENARYFWM